MLLTPEQRAALAAALPALEALAEPDPPAPALQVTAAQPRLTGSLAASCLGGSR